LGVLGSSLPEVATWQIRLVFHALRKKLTVLVSVALMLAMMVLSAMPLLAAPQAPNNPDNNSRNSCGVSNPDIGAFPPTADNKDASGEFTDCGLRNNPNFEPQ
jgi:hypothetical protein